MFPILYNENDISYGSVPQDNGLGVLSDALSCIITEERNGAYELEMTYPASGLHAKDIAVRHILKVKPNFTDDPQLFRIYKVGKVLGSSFKINARHISYDLSGSSIESGTAGSAVSACLLLSTNEFSIDTDKNVTASFSITEPSSRRSWLGGKAGSLLDVFGTGEYHYDNFDIHFLTHRGTDRGVEVRYGKNLLSLTQEKDSSNLTTHIILFWKSQEDGTLIYSAKTATGVTLDCEQTQCIDVTADYNEAPTVAQLNARAQQYIQEKNYSIAKNSLKLNFLQIKTLKDRVDLCDTVKIIYEDYNIDVTAKCVKTIWNALQERYDSIELGDIKANFADTFIAASKETQKVINTQASTLQKAIENATALITGNSGGYVVLHDSDNDGEPDEILIMNTADISTARKVWRWNQSGLGYSSTGYAGTYALAMTINGAIVANFVTTGTMSANRVRAGRLEDTSGQNYFDLDSGQAHFNNLSLTIGGTSTDAATAIANAQSTADGKVSPNAVRTAFAADSTSITVQSGTIRFKANTLLIDFEGTPEDAETAITNAQTTANGAATAASNAASAAATAQATANGKVSPNEVRTKFAADATSITIQSGTITFNSNTFVVNSTNLSITAAGKLTCTGADISGDLKANTLATGSRTGSGTGTAGTYIDSSGAIYCGSTNAFTVTSAGKVTASNIEITGGSIHITTNSSTNNIIQLASGDYSNLMSAGGISITHKESSTSQTRMNVHQNGFQATLDTVNSQGQITGWYTQASLSANNGSFALYDTNHKFRNQIYASGIQHYNGSAQLVAELAETSSGYGTLNLRDGSRTRAIVNDGGAYWYDSAGTLRCWLNPTGGLSFYNSSGSRTAYYAAS